MIIYEEILRAFQKQRVKYILVGGLATNLHGYLRATADLDILVEMSSNNLKKVVKILKKHGYIVKQPVDPADIADEKIRKSWIKNKHMKAFNFYKERDFKEVDILIDSPVSYETAKREVKRIKIADIILPVISIRHLIRMKHKTGRPIDNIDVAMLKRIGKIKKENGL